MFGGVSPVVTKTVDDLRNEIRAAVGRHERLVSTVFTKEALAAIANAVGHDVDTDSLPSKPQMRAGILHALGELDGDDPDDAPTAFRKHHLQTIADALGDN